MICNECETVAHCMKNGCIPKVPQVSKQTEALKLALEALKTYHYYMIDAGLPNQSLLNEVFTAHKALEEAMAEQPAQQTEPCGWRMKHNGEWAYSFTEDAWDFIRRVPKAQQQEPVAYASDVEFDDETEIIPAEQKGKLGTAGLRIPLYIDPPASKPWVGLTDDEIEDAWPFVWRKHESVRHFAIYHAIEAKLREKNT